MIRQFTLTLSILIISVISLSAQEFQEISCGAGYKYQSYVQLAAGTEKQVNNDAWDIAFTAFGFQDAGILINESSASIQGENVPQTELYYTGNSDFNASFDLNQIIKGAKLYNSKASWNDGAFNALKDTTNAFDYGWGAYNPATHSVTGTKVFVLKLRSGKYIKLMVEALNGTDYVIRYADIDGQNEKTKTFSKTKDNAGQKLIYYTFTDDKIVDILPQGGFDLFWGRYVSWATDPNGTIQQWYTVTGILTAPGVQTAVAKGVNPETVSVDPYLNSFSQKIDQIGYDWKTLVGTSWTLATDRAFFVKLPDNNVWKLAIVDFEGSATGTATLQKYSLGNPTSTHDLKGTKLSFYPNPIQNELIISLDVAQLYDYQYDVVVTDLAGRPVMSTKVNATEGWNVLKLDTSNLASGAYLVRVSNSNGTLAEKIIKY